MTESNIDNATAGQPGDDAPITEASAPADVPSEEPKRHRGAQPGNTNTVKHGLRSQRFGIAYSKSSKKMRGAWFDGTRLRKELESEVRKRNGGRLSVLNAAKIQSILRLELACRSLEVELRDNPDMQPEAVRIARESICRWSCQRDNALAALLTDRPAGGGLDWSTPLPGQES